MSPAPLGLARALLLASLANASRLRGVPPPWTAALVFSLVSLLTAWRSRAARGRRLFDEPAHLPVALLCLTAYLATMRWHGGDDIPNSLIPFGLLRHGTLSLEPFRAKFETETLADFFIHHTDPLLSIFSVVPAVLALPAYLLPALFGGPPNDFGLHNLSKVSGALLTAASAAVVYAACRRRADGRWSALCALAYGLGTWSWSVSSQALHSHGPTQLGAALGMLGLLGEDDKDAALAGLGFALAMSSREDSVFFIVAAGLYYLLHRTRRLPAFLAGAAPPLLFNLAYWLWYTGVPKPPYMAAQGGMFGVFRTDALAGLLVSPTRGLVWFSPVVLFGVWALADACRDKDRRWAPYLLAAGPLLLAFLCFRTTWTGGQTFGPRYFAMAAAVWAVAMSHLRPGRAGRAAFAALFAFSAVVHGVGAFFPYPGSFSTVGAEAELWRWDLHPLPNLLCDAGPMGGLPAALRLGALLGFLSAGAWLGRWAYRFSGGSTDAIRRL
ncbi:MAG: hypothetical protein HYV15_03410 [Elusimicrobia bacterium]|nr:hypothetical protein [Elusimicrobiota bacterium]